MMTTSRTFFFLIIFLHCFDGFAQETEKSKEIKNTFPQIKFPRGSIDLKISPFGYYLESNIPDVSSVECEQSLVEVVRYLYFFSRSIKTRQELRGKCPKYKLGASYFSSDYKKGSNQVLEDILRYYFKQKNKKDLTIENYFQVIQKLESYKKSLLREVLILHWHFYFNRLDNVRIHLKRIVSVDVSTYLLDLNYKKEREVINDKDAKIRLNQIVDELLTLANSRLQKNIFSVLINYLGHFEWSEVSLELQEKIQILGKAIEGDEISSYVRDFRWGKTIPNNWGKSVQSLLGSEKLESYIETFWKIPSQVKNDVLVIPYLEFLYKPKYRNEVLGKIKSLKDSKKKNDQRYYYEFVGSSILGGKKLNGEVLIPARAFQEKRIFYSKIFKKNEWKLFSLYHLISLGDLKEYYLNEL